MSKPAIHYRGKVDKGVIVLENGATLPDGTKVLVEPLPPDAVRNELDPVFLMSDLATDTGISDLSVNADHYLYGHPKTGDTEC